ncbi:MAG: DHH family phosphoesterase [Flavobacteriales bacterium]|nr:DHH family phosphoesterase [Flavobacteriales bacterium]
MISSTTDPYLKAVPLIQNAQRIVVTAHKSPDGDAVGSSIGLAKYLIKKGKDVSVVLPDGFADFLNWMPGTEDIKYYDKDTAEVESLLSEADLIFCLDYNDISRVGKMRGAMEALIGQKAFILIDHHQHPQDFPDVLISDTSSCSTAQLIFRFIDRMGDRVYLDKEIGACLYCGIMTDSGSFRFPSVDEETHQIAAEIIKLGVDHAQIHRNVYDTNLLDRLRLVGYALSEKLVVLPEYRTAYISLSAEELTRFNYRPGDTEGLVNQALSIKGVNFAAFIREGNNEVKLSLRSQGSFKVNEVAAAYFNGGGHNNAAGGAIAKPLEAVVQQFNEILPQYKKELNYDL